MPAFTKAQYAALKALIDSEAANVGRTAAEILAWGDELAGNVPRTAGDLMEVVLLTQEYGVIEAAAADSAHLANEAARNAVALLRERDRVVDYSDPQKLTALQNATQALVDGGLIAAGTKTVIDGLGVGQITRWAAAGLRRPTEHQIDVAVNQTWWQ